MPIVKTGLCNQLAFVASAIVLAAAALPASAGGRAPITYVRDSGAAASVTAAKPSAPAGKADKAAQRIEFRYPGSSREKGRFELASVSVPARTESVADKLFTEAPRFSSGVRAFDAPATATQITAIRAPVVESVALPPVAVVKPAQITPGHQTSPGERAVAIVYGDEFAGLPTANGEIFDQSALTAAHPSLPLPSIVRVSNPATGREVKVRVNDRGPFEDGASLQVSRQVAVLLGFEGAGKAELVLQPAEGAAPAVSKTRSDYKPALLVKEARAVAADELLGGNEPGGSAGQGAKPAGATKTRASVVWPEPPADWGVGPATSKVRASVSGTHYVQLASFTDIGNAERLYRGLRSDMAVEIVPARVDGADFFRVRVGPLASRAAAQELRDRLNAEGKGDGRVITAE
jgi:rare lipoprotein A